MERTRIIMFVTDRNYHLYICLPVVRLATIAGSCDNGITSTSEAAGYRLDGTGLAISGTLCNSIKIREV